MLRFIIASLTVILFLILSIPLLLVLWLIGKKWPHARDIASLRIIQRMFRILLGISGVHITEIGRENLPADRSFLLVANHRSIFDILILESRMPDLTGIVSKKEMDRYPILNLWMRLIHCLFLDRSDLRQGVRTIQAAAENVSSGISMIIFPEGTRTDGPDEADMLPFHEGSFRISTKTGCPMVAAAITNSQNIFEAHLPRLCRTNVIVEYLPPVDPTALSVPEQKKLGETTRSLLQTRLKENRKKLEET